MLPPSSTPASSASTSPVRCGRWWLRWVSAHAGERPRRVMLAASILLLTTLTVTGLLIGAVLLPWSSPDGLGRYWWLLVLAARTRGAAPSAGRGRSHRPGLALDRWRTARRTAVHERCAARRGVGRAGVGAPGRPPPGPDGRLRSRRPARRRGRGRRDRPGMGRGAGVRAGPGRRRGAGRRFWCSRWLPWWAVRPRSPWPLLRACCWS